MDAPPATRSPRINRLLPYCAVFQADLHQTMRSWVYRLWLIVSVLGTVGYLIYMFAAKKEAAIVQYSSVLVSDLLRWSVLASVALIVVLTGGSISAERGTLADSILSRGISRHQYFLGKWHARLIVVLGTFFAMGLLALGGGWLLLTNDLNLVGSLAALIMIGSILALVVSCGVAVSAVTPSSVVGIAVLWGGLYGMGFLMTLLPADYPSPDRLLANMGNVLRGYYDPTLLLRMLLASVIGSSVMSLVGLVYFSRRDV